VDKTRLSNLLTAEQVAQLFSIKVRQVKELARQGRIPGVQTEINSRVDRIIKEVLS